MTNKLILNHNAVLRKFYMPEMDVHSALIELCKMDIVVRWELAQEVVKADPTAAVYYTQYN
tara:strand:+ start:1153 stop:1335 length:183 start_codon:yes stop_codon:yes gene_type:complete